LLCRKHVNTNRKHELILHIRNKRNRTQFKISFVLYAPFMANKYFRGGGGGRATSSTLPINRVSIRWLLIFHFLTA